MREILIAILCAMPFWLHAQEIKYCGQTEQTQKLFERFPEAHRHAADLEEIEETASYQERGGGEVLIIPVVFHIIHEGGVENISDDQVHDAIDVLNRDMRMLNPDIENVDPNFAELTADIQIEFRLAQIDPDGNCTKGINRIQSPLTNEGGFDMKGLIIWPRDMYMNVWVCKYAQGAAGYTYRPGAVAGNWGLSQDGIVLRHDYTGSIGTGSVSRSRTLTHEVGHWLNLMHTWGGSNEPVLESNCDMDDNVSDTPLTRGWTSCNDNPITCGSLDNIENYMEYSGCGKMFTQGQRTRVRNAAFSNTADRNELWTIENLVATGVADDPILCDADFSASEKVVCVGSPVVFTDGTYNGAQTWTWNFGDGNVLDGGEFENPIHTYTEPGVYTVSLTASNGFEEVSEVKEAYITVLDQGEKPLPFTEGFEEGFVMEDWRIFNADEGDTFEWTDEASNFGDHCLFLNNRDNDLDNNRDEIISTTIDASGLSQLTIEYYWAYANRSNETDDRFRISISPDCGQSWALRKQHRGLTDLPTHSPTNTNFVPDEDEWQYGIILIDNPEDLSAELRIKFEFEGRGGNNFFLDDINIAAFAVSVDEFDTEDGVVVFPNPTDNRATVQWSSEIQPTLLTVMGSDGKLIQEFQAHQLLQAGKVNVDLSQVSRGLYFVVLRDENGLLRRTRLVKK